MKYVDSYISVSSKDSIKLDGSESYIRMDNELKIFIKSALSKLSFNTYPNEENTKVRALYADYVKNGIREDNILLCNGSSEILSFIIIDAIREGDKILTLSPECMEYEKYASFMKGEVIRYECEKDGAVNIDEFIKLGKEEGVNLVMFSNPNNPTGHALSLTEIEKILNAFKDIYVVVDEAFYEFYGETAVKLINKYNNLLVTRTLSRGWGLSSIRVGFLISNKDVINRFKKIKIKFSVSNVSEMIAEKVLENPKKILSKVNSIINEREKLYSILKNIEEEAALEVHFYKSNADYIFGRTPYKEALIKGLYSAGIHIRDFEDDSFRITVGSTFENNRIIDALKKIFMYEGE
ncbi:MAG: aminotransferase class I/II-fold pyridoxal phosphate-dependent enzyme [Clostridium sp.]|nr:aminotransferase class I/II-fold pyridoxal phosphate-dependent enzyme [Clostridium sp.]